MVWYQNIFWRMCQIYFGVHHHFSIRRKIIYHNKRPEPPYFFMANHAHIEDPYITGVGSLNAINYMANVEAVSMLIKFASNLVGVFPKRKGVPDYKAIKKMFDLLKQGHVVGIYPEGDRTWDGETGSIPENISRIIKKADVPLRLCHVSGSYLSFPRWAVTKRKGRVIVEYDTVTLDEIRKLNEKQLFKRITSFLYQNDIKDSKWDNVVFSGKNLALGIKYLLWLCPVCENHNSIYGEGNRIICSQCGSYWEVNGNQKIVSKGIKSGDMKSKIKDLKDWSDWQKKKISEICSSKKNKILTKTENINAWKRGEKDEYLGTGVLILYKDKIEFVPGGHEKKIEFRVSDIMFYVDNFNKNLQFNCHHERYKFVFNQQNDNKWIYFLRYLQGIDK